MILSIEMIDPVLDSSHPLLYVELVLVQALLGNCTMLKRLNTLGDLPDASRPPGEVSPDRVRLWSFFKEYLRDTEHDMNRQCIKMCAKITIMNHV